MPNILAQQQLFENFSKYQLGDIRELLEILTLGVMTMDIRSNKHVEPSALIRMRVTIAQLC
jgi:hypothetical protein